jgi:hypothetical protein
MTSYRLAQMNTSRILTATARRQQAADEFRQRTIDRALRKMLKLAIEKPADADADERPSS